MFALNKEDRPQRAGPRVRGGRRTRSSTSRFGHGAGGSLDAAAWAAMPFGEYAERYVERRVGVISPRVDRQRKALPEVRQGDDKVDSPEGARRRGRRAVRARGAPPVRGWALEKRRRERRTGGCGRRGGSRGGPPLAVRVAGPAMQSKVLKFVREVLNDAVDREHVGRNVAKKRFLSKGFRKGRPLIDPLMEDEAEGVPRGGVVLPLDMTKVAVLILLSTGMRPEEMLAQRVGTFVPAEEGETRRCGSWRPCAREG